MKTLGKLQLLFINAVFRTIDFVSEQWPIVLVFSVMGLLISVIYFGGLYG